MITIAAALIVAAAVVWAALHIASSRAAGGSRREERTLAILTAFAPAIDAAQQSPRALLVWQPLARTARALFPEEFASLDRATGALRKRAEHDLAHHSANAKGIQPRAWMGTQHLQANLVLVSDLPICQQHHHSVWRLADCFQQWSE